MAGMYGDCVFFNNNKLTKISFSDESPALRDIDSWHYKNMNMTQHAIVDGWLKPHGVTLDQLAKHYSFRHLVNAATYQNMEHLGTDKFIQKQETLFDNV